MHEPTIDGSRILLQDGEILHVNEKIQDFSVYKNRSIPLEKIMFLLELFFADFHHFLYPNSFLWINNPHSSIHQSLEGKEKKTEQMLMMNPQYSFLHSDFSKPGNHDREKGEKHKK